jgi:hypothetical protein
MQSLSILIVNKQYPTTDFLRGCIPFAINIVHPELRQRMAVGETHGGHCCFSRFIQFGSFPAVMRVGSRKFIECRICTVVLILGFSFGSDSSCVASLKIFPFCRSDFVHMRVYCSAF